MMVWMWGDVDVDVGMWSGGEYDDDDEVQYCHLDPVLRCVKTMVELSFALSFCM